MSTFPKNRYVPEEFAAAFDNVTIEVAGEECVASLVIGNDGDEVEVSFPANSGQCTESSKGVVREVLSQISNLDDLVQESCEEECDRTGIDSRNFELYLTYIQIGGSKLTLGYYGSKVNTEWDAEFNLVNGQWKKSNF